MRGIKLLDSQLPNHRNLKQAHECMPGLCQTSEWVPFAAVMILRTIHIRTSADTMTACNDWRTAVKARAGISNVECDRCGGRRVMKRILVGLNVSSFIKSVWTRFQDQDSEGRITCS
jgi:hypothetical protein